MQPALAVVPSPVLLTGKWSSLGAQLLTPVTLATHSLVHSHALVEQMETGHPLNPPVKVSVFCRDYSL